MIWHTNKNHHQHHHTIILLVSVYVIIMYTLVHAAQHTTRDNFICAWWMELANNTNFCQRQFYKSIRDNDGAHTLSSPTSSYNSFNARACCGGTCFCCSISVHGLIPLSSSRNANISIQNIGKGTYYHGLWHLKTRWQCSRKIFHALQWYFCIPIQNMLYLLIIDSIRVQCMDII